MPPVSPSTVCLLIHGYLGNSFELRPLAAPLEALGLNVRLVTLPGHDSTLEEFRRTGFTDWLRHVEAEYDRAAQEYERIMVIGFSLGGALALHMAETRNPLAVVTLAAPVFPARSALRQLFDWMRIFMPLSRITGQEKVHRPGSKETQEIAPWEGYREAPPVSQFYGILRGFRRIGKDLRKVSAPILVMHDIGDRVVNSDNAMAIIARVSSKRCELEITRMREELTVHHLITTHRETKNLVINRVRAFVASVCGLPEPGIWQEDPGAQYDE